MITVFAIKKGRKYLQGFEANEKYKKAVRAIQSSPHLPSEYKAIWSDTQNWLDARSAGGYLRDLARVIADGGEKVKRLVIEVGEE